MQRTLVGLIASVLIATACGTGTPAGQASPGTVATATPTQAGPRLLVIAGAGAPNSLDAHDISHTLTFGILSDSIYDSLLKFNAKSEFEPRIAESIETSSDGKTWTLRLKKGVTFHDGTPLDAAAVKYNLDRLAASKDPDLGRRLAQGTKISDFASTEVVDVSTVRLNLKAPSAVVRSALVIGLVSPAGVQKYGKDFATNPVGSGPYRFSEWVTGDRIVMERNPDYWGPKAYFDKITYRLVPDASTRVAMIQTGEADIATTLGPEEIAQLKGNEKLELLIQPSTRVMHIGINVTKPPFDNVLVRKALNLAVDKEAIVKSVLAGFGRVADSPAADGQVGYGPGVKPYGFDQAQAKRLLAEAGYPNGFKTTLMVPNGRYFRDKEIAEAVQGYLKQVGVDVTLQVQEYATHIAKLREPAGNYTLYLMSWSSSSGDAGVQFTQAFTCASIPTFNWNRLCDKELDTLILDANATVDPAARIAKNTVIQQRLMDRAAWLYLTIDNQAYALKQGLKGVFVIPQEMMFVREAHY